MLVIAVDDEFPNIVSMKTILQNQTNGEVKVFQFSDDAIEFAKKNKIDIAFLDIEMPEINGIELARRLRELNPHIDIIFTTAYRKYGAEAFGVVAADYILKPVTETAVRKSFERLRFSSSEVTEKIDTKNGIVAITFSRNLKIYSNGTEIKFSRKKSLELLALLIDRHGKPMSRRSIFTILFENKDYSRKNQDYLQKVIADLKANLKAYGAEEIFIAEKNSYSIDVSKIICDLYEQEKNGKKTFRGEYLSDYWWAENTLALLDGKWIDRIG